MITPTLRKSQLSPIARITLKSVFQSNEKFARLRRSQEEEIKLPKMKKNFTVSPHKNQDRSLKLGIYKKPLKVVNPGFENIDRYLDSVLGEYNLNQKDLRDTIYFLNKNKRKNAFDKFFGPKGAEEERKLVDYVDNCDKFSDYKTIKIYD